MRNSIVLVPFPFDDLSANKVRPAVCLTNEVEPYGHVVLAFITSQLSDAPAFTDIVINEKDDDFELTGLKVSSMLRLHRLMTVSSSIIQRRLGEITSTQNEAIKERLRALFEI